MTRGPRAKRILLVEDAPDQRALIQLVFKDADGAYEVDECESGTEALAKAAKSRYDIILLDYMLPGCSGMDVLKTLRRDGNATPVLFMTALKNATLTIEAMRQGISDFILKEGAFQLLLPEVVKKLLEKIDLERRLAEAEEERRFQSAKLASLGKLLSEILHELRNPLSIIATGLESLRDAKDKERAVALTLDLMLRNVERTRQVVSGLLDFTRPKPYDFKPADLRAIVSEMAGHLKLKCERQRIALSVEGAASLPPVTLDAQHLKGALLNLMMNAIEAMPAGGTLTLRLGASDGHARVEVCDTGEGISPENECRLFERHFTTKENGTGLGLIITHDIVEKHRGRLEVLSEPGQGTSFAIVLPLDGGAQK